MTRSDAVMIEARGVEKWYPNGFRALRGVDLTVEQGEVVVLPGDMLADMPKGRSVSGQVLIITVGLLLMKVRDRAVIKDLHF
jgi:ABC-type polar amino acid transport system ATPase subunit